MVTKKQHYYPRTLIKHFANKDDKLYTYIRIANRIQYINYKNVCAENYTYEGSSGVDNILENNLGVLESKIGPIVNKIINNIVIKNDRITIDLREKEIDFLYKYINLQYLRTDTGRISFVRGFGNINYVRRKFPYKIEEIKRSKNKEILDFNDRFKQTGVLENFIKFLKKPKNMYFHILIGENYITSDNPVIMLDEGKQIFMPISNNICVVFQTDEFSNADEVILPYNVGLNRYINECQIETSNYYIMSIENFDLLTNWYIYRRFHEKDWEKKSKHFK